MNAKNVDAENVIAPAELNRRLAGGEACDLLDVRTGPEFAAAHVPGARLATLDRLDPAGFMRARGTCDRTVYLICQSGSRARKAAQQFKAAGFGGCVVVEGGTQGWVDAGLPVIRGQSRVLPLMRQVQVTVGLVSAVGALLALTVNPLFALIPLVMGSGLLFAGLTGICGLALLLAKMPWNEGTGCGDGSCDRQQA
jgi:rhodanese-related sulfurtransferase